MKVYTKIVYDKDDNIIEEQSYDYNGPVAQAKFEKGPGQIRNEAKGYIHKGFKETQKKIGMIFFYIRRLIRSTLT